MNRRTLLLSGFVAATAAPVILVRSRNAYAAQPIEIGPMVDPARVNTADKFFAAVLPRAELSLVSSQAAVNKASNKNAKEFAGFELGEAIGVNGVIKDMDIIGPAVGKDSDALSAELILAGEGEAFDRAYIAFQLANHEYLRNLADGYLYNTVATTDMAEKHGRHLASLMLGAFKEHTAICKRITGELAA